MRHAFHDWILQSTRRRQMKRTESLMSDMVTQDSKRVCFDDWRNKLHAVRQKNHCANEKYQIRIQNHFFNRWKFFKDRRQFDNCKVARILSHANQRNLMFYCVILHVEILMTSFSKWKNACIMKESTRNRLDAFVCKQDFRKREIVFFAWRLAIRYRHLTTFVTQYCPSNSLHVAKSCRV